MRGARSVQPTVRPIQRLTAGGIGSDLMTLDSADSVFAGFAAFGAFAVGFALPFAAVPFAVAGAPFFFGLSPAGKARKDAELPRTFRTIVVKHCA